MRWQGVVDFLVLATAIYLVLLPPGLRLEDVTPESVRVELVRAPPPRPERPQEAP